MRRLRSSGLLLACSLLAGPAAAQAIPETRASEASAARQQKAAALAPAPVDKLEKFLDFVERNAEAMATGRDGFSVRFGGIDDGSSWAAGPAWQTTRPLNGRLTLRASAAASIFRDHEIDLTMSLPELASHRLSLDVTASRGHLAQERFFGTGPSSAQTNETSFALDSGYAGMTATVAATPWFRASLGAAVADYSVADGGARLVPSIFARWERREVAGLEEPTSFTVLAASTTADWRDVPGNPRRGGRYDVRFERFSNRAQNRYSFNRLNVELEQHLSWWRKQRVLTLRGVAVLSSPDAGNDVPFYLQPTLGGSRLLRGFVTERFRDRNLMALQAEYGWDLWPFLGAVLFYESGTVAPDWKELSLESLKRDYGIGFRFGSARSVALRTDVAFGSGEGTRLAVRFSHAF
jgi:outer membrane protein assembly factor BamA